MGVSLVGGDRVTLRPSEHFVRNSTLHDNQRWIMNYAPDVLLGGVGQTIQGCDIFGSPQIAVFFMGNDHSLLDSVVHSASTQCTDCGAFYMGRDCELAEESSNANARQVRATPKLNTT